MKKILCAGLLSVAAIGCATETTENVNSNVSAGRIDRTAANAVNPSADSTAVNAGNTATIMASNLNSLKTSKGKTASESKFWENKEMVIRVQELLGANYAAMEKNWNVETPIRSDGDVTMMTGCESQNCGENQYVVFADTAKNNLNVFHLQKGEVKIYKEKDEIILPKKFAAELAVLKSNAKIKRIEK